MVDSAHRLPVSTSWTLLIHGPLVGAINALNDKGLCAEGHCPTIQRIALERDSRARSVAHWMQAWRRRTKVAEATRQESRPLGPIRPRNGADETIPRDDLPVISRTPPSPPQIKPMYSQDLHSNYSAISSEGTSSNWLKLSYCSFSFS